MGISVASVEQLEYEGTPGIIQLRFRDEEGTTKDINAAELAEVLQGIVSFTSVMAQAELFGSALPPTVRVRPPVEGSFVIEALLTWTQQAVEKEPVGAVGVGLTAAGSLAKAIFVGIKRLRGAIAEDYEYLPNGQIKVKWGDGTVNEMPPKVWDRLKELKRPTKKAMRQLMAPLGDDVDFLEVREAHPDASTEETLIAEPEAVATRDDYKVAAIESDETHEERRDFEMELQLQSIDFRQGQRWRVLTSDGGSRLAAIEDRDFLRELDAGSAIHKDDVFWASVHEVDTIKNNRHSREWTITKIVKRKRLGGEDVHNDQEISPTNRQ